MREQLVLPPHYIVPPIRLVSLSSTWRSQLNLKICYCCCCCVRRRQGWDIGRRRSGKRSVVVRMGVMEEEMVVRRMAINRNRDHNKKEKLNGREDGARGSMEEKGMTDGNGNGGDEEFVVEEDQAGLRKEEHVESAKGLLGIRERILGIRKMLGMGGDGGLRREVRNYNNNSNNSGNVSVETGRAGSFNMRMLTRNELGVFAWELLVVVGLLALLRAGVARTLRLIHTRLGGGLQRGRRIVPYESSVFECMQRPLEFSAIFMVGTALAEAVSRPLAAAGLLRYIRKLRELGVIFAATWFLLRWIDRIKTRFAADRRIDKAQVDATSRISTVATTIIALLISLDTIGVNIQTVLAFGGIGGVAIGFAGREIISNFFGGFMIYITRPFTVGEWIRSIESDYVNGTVEDIGWYLTRVRTWDKRPLYIPNSRFSTLIIENPSRMSNRRILHTVHIRIEDMPVVRNIVDDVQSMLMRHPELDPKQHRLVYVDGFDEFSVQIWLSCYTKSVFLYDFRSVQQQILLDTYEIIRNRGARLATITTRDLRQGENPDRYGALQTAVAPVKTDREHDESNGKPSTDRKDSPVDLDALADSKSPVQLFGEGEGPRDVPVFATLWDNDKADFLNIESGVRRAPEGSERNSAPVGSGKDGKSNTTDTGISVTGAKSDSQQDSDTYSKTKDGIGVATGGEEGKSLEALSGDNRQRPTSEKEYASPRNTDAPVAGVVSSAHASRKNVTTEQESVSSGDSRALKEDTPSSGTPKVAREPNVGANIPEERQMKFSAAPRRSPTPEVPQPISMSPENDTSDSGRSVDSKAMSMDDKKQESVPSGTARSLQQGKQEPVTGKQVGRDTDGASAAGAVSGRITPKKNIASDKTKPSSVAKEDKSSLGTPNVPHGATGGAATTEERRMKFSAAPRRSPISGMQHSEGDSHDVAKPSKGRPIDEKKASTKEKEQDNMPSKVSSRASQQGAQESRIRSQSNGVSQDESLDRKRQETLTASQDADTTNIGQPVVQEMKISAAPPLSKITEPAQSKEMNGASENLVRVQASSGGSTTKPAALSTNGGQGSGSVRREQTPRERVEEGQMKISKAPPRPKIIDETEMDDSGRKNTTAEN